MVELNAKEVEAINGGGPIADAVEWFLCAIGNTPVHLLPAPY